MIIILLLVIIVILLPFLWPLALAIACLYVISFAAGMVIGIINAIFRRR